MRNRTADLLLTMETLCLLSYRGAQMPRDGRHQRTKIHTAPRPGRIRVMAAVSPSPSGSPAMAEWLEIRRTLVTTTAPAPVDIVRS